VHLEWAVMALKGSQPTEGVSKSRAPSPDESGVVLKRGGYLADIKCPGNVVG
jgi:hypothetical protein